MIEQLLKMTTFLYPPVDEIRLLHVDRFWVIHVYNILRNRLPVQVGTGRGKL